MFYKNKRYEKGFTLSEVLLVLTVIGVVASLTIPTVTQKVGNNQNLSRLKKTYSTLSQTFNLLATDNGGDITINSALWDSNATDGNVLNAFATKMNFVKTCPVSGGGCWYSTNMYYLNSTMGSQTTNADTYNARGILADGTFLMFRSSRYNCKEDESTLNDGNPIDAKVCGYAITDLNGNTGPNTIGRDVFYFYITQSGIYPVGTSFDTFTWYRASDCNPADSSNGRGYGCTGKVLTEGTINY